MPALLPLTGAWSSPRRANPLQRKKRSRKFAGVIGGRFTGSLGHRGLDPKMHRTWSKSFLLPFSGGKISEQYVRKKGVYVPTCLYRLSDFSRASGIGQMQLSGIKRARRFR